MAMKILPGNNIRTIGYCKLFSIVCGAQHRNHGFHLKNCIVLTAFSIRLHETFVAITEV